MLRPFASAMPAEGVTEIRSRVSTLSPCIMCTGTALLDRVSRIIIGENQNFMGAEDLLSQRGVEFNVLQDSDCILMMGDFIRDHADLWNEDTVVLQIRAIQSERRRRQSVDLSAEREPLAHAGEDPAQTCSADQRMGRRSSRGVSLPESNAHSPYRITRITTICFGKSNWYSRAEC